MSSLRERWRYRKRRRLDGTWWRPLRPQDDDVLYDYSGEIPPPRLDDSEPPTEMMRRGYRVAFVGYDPAVGSDYVAYMRTSVLGIQVEEEDDYESDPYPSDWRKALLSAEFLEAYPAPLEERGVRRVCLSCNAIYHPFDGGCPHCDPTFRECTLCGELHLSIYVACYRCRLQRRTCSAPRCNEVFYASHKTHETLCPTHDSTEEVCTRCGARMYRREGRGYSYCARCFDCRGDGAASCERCREPIDGRSRLRFCWQCRFVTSTCSGCSGLFRVERDAEAHHAKCYKCRRWEEVRDCNECGGSYCPAVKYATKELCRRCARRSRREKRKCENCSKAFMTWKASDHAACRTCIQLRRPCRDATCSAYVYISQERADSRRLTGAFCPTHAPPPRKCSRCDDGVIPYGDDW